MSINVDSEIQIFCGGFKLGFLKFSYCPPTGRCNGNWEIIFWIYVLFEIGQRSVPASTRPHQAELTQPRNPKNELAVTEAMCKAVQQHASLHCRSS